MAVNGAKLSTKFPGLHQANGVKPEDMNVIADAPVKTPEQIAAESSANNSEQGASPATAAKAPPNLEDYSDEEKNELLAKLTGGKVKTLEELNPPVQKTKEEIEEERVERKKEATAWAISNDKIKLDQYNKAISEKDKTNRELALSVFSAELREEDKDITDEEAEELFKDAMHEEAEAGSKLNTIGLRTIKNIADNYRKQHLSVLDNLETDYDNFLSTESQFKAYKSQVKNIVSAIAKDMEIEIPYTDLDGTETIMKYVVPVDDKIRNKLLSDFSDQEIFISRNITLGNKSDEKVLAADLNYHLRSRIFDNTIKTLLNDHGHKVEEALLVRLGQKRNEGAGFNDGRQKLPGTTQKTNSYSGLHEAMAKQNN